MPDLSMHFPHRFLRFSSLDKIMYRSGEIVDSEDVLSFETIRTAMFLPRLPFHAPLLVQGFLIRFRTSWSRV